MFKRMMVSNPFSSAVIPDAERTINSYWTNFIPVKCGTHDSQAAERLSLYFLARTHWYLPKYVDQTLFHLQIEGKFKSGGTVTQH